MTKGTTPKRTERATHPCYRPKTPPRFIFRTTGHPPGANNHAIMQNALIEPRTLPDLPAPSPVELWIFEQPLLPAIALIIAALLTLVLTRHRPLFKRAALLVALPMLMLAAGIYATGTRIVTQRELLSDRSRSLVASVADNDPATLRSLLDPEARLASAFASVQGSDRIAHLVASRVPGVVRSAVVSEVRAGIYEGDLVATTQIRVRVKGTGAPSLSWWRVDWQRADENATWLASDIEPLWIQGMTNPGPRN